MLRMSPTLVMQSSINLANNEFGKGVYGEDEARILSASSASKNLTRAGYLIFGTKKVFNFLRHVFIQAPIF